MAIKTEDKLKDIKWHIDAGYINQRKVFSVFGDHFTKIYTDRANPDNTFPNSLFNNHLLVSLSIDFCKVNNIPSLSECLQSPTEGQIFSSIEEYAGNEKVYEEKRIKNQIITPFEYDKNVCTEFSTDYIINDTGRHEQAENCRIATIGRIYRVTNDEVVIHPLIMGGPTFDHPKNHDLSVNVVSLSFSGARSYEIFPHEIDQFAKCKDIKLDPADEWMETMSSMNEQTIKENFAKLLGDITTSDWGGELNDHFSSEISIIGTRITGAFLLKGPAGGNKFKPMKPTFLGKNGDQIFRLSTSPAQILFVQHCHDIEESVRATLKAFAVSPHNPRKYCFLDGKDTYRIFKAYNLV